MLKNSQSANRCHGLKLAVIGCHAFEPLLGRFCLEALQLTCSCGYQVYHYQATCWTMDAYAETFALIPSSTMSRMKQLGSKILNRVATLGICLPARQDRYTACFLCMLMMERITTLFFFFSWPRRPRIFLDFPLFAPSCCCWKWKCPSEWSDRCRALLAKCCTAIFLSHKAVASNLDHGG